MTNQCKFNKGISTLIGILIIVVFALIVGGVLVWQYLGVQKEELKLAEIKVPEKTTTDETAGRKIYRNEEYGFEVKYPRDTLVEVPIQQLLPPNYKDKFSGIKLISVTKLDKMGKKDCSYGESGLTSICTAEAEGGMELVFINKKFQEVADPITNKEDISIIGRNGIDIL